MHVFWGMKKLVQLKFVQLLLLNRVKEKWSKNRAAQGFYYINSFSSNIFGTYSKTCTCKVRAAWGRVSRGLTVYPTTFKVWHWNGPGLKIGVGKTGVEISCNHSSLKILTKNSPSLMRTPSITYSGWKLQDTTNFLHASIKLWNNWKKP